MKVQFEEANGNTVLVEHESELILVFKGSLDAIYHLVEVANPKSFKEEDLIEKVGRFAIILDSPGIGKSTILTNISRILKRSRPSTWVLRFDLNDQKVAKVIKLI